jgi:hypothetical protein
MQTVYKLQRFKLLFTAAMIAVNKPLPKCNQVLYFRNDFVDSETMHA